MGMFDDVVVEVPLPDGFDPAGVEFQTKDFDCRLERYTITADGRLVARRVEYEMTPEEEMPYYGKPEWGDETSLFRLIGCMREVRSWDEEVPFHGDLVFYCYERGVFREYTARFTEGRLAGVTGGAVPNE
jgi:hypothetical protein